MRPLGVSEIPSNGYGSRMTFRIETDSMGDVRVPSERYWGAQTQRSLQNFTIGGHRFGVPILRAFAITKKAAALANAELGVLEREKVDLIVRVCDEIIEGRWNDEFPLVIWQTGSGTQSNMNANEVIANRASELAGAPLGSRTPLHPNDDVNRSQSSNDVFPTVMHVAATEQLTHRLLPAVGTLRAVVEAKANAFAGVVKIGRTHLMDATPLTLGQELSGWAAQLEQAEARLGQAAEGLADLAIGGTAVGTGLNAPARFGELAAAHVAKLTGLPFRSAKNKFAALSAHDALVFASSATRLLAVACMKIANDVRILASGPRCGIGELLLPENEPGSSIMPGKVNPTQAEALTMVAAQVIGNDTTIAIAGMGGHLQLNAFKPVIIHDLLESIALLADACESFAGRCMAGVEPDREVIARHVSGSLMLVTALTPVVGYDSAARIAKKAQVDGTTLKEAAVSLGILTADEFDVYVRPERMTSPP